MPRSTQNLLRELQECYATQRRLEAQLCDRDLPALPAAPGPTPPPVPDRLARLLHLEGQQMTPFTLARHLYTYITDHDLLDAQDRHQIHPNRRLRRALGMEEEDTLDLYNLQVYLCQLYQ